MKISISTAASFIFITFCSVLFVHVMNFQMAIQKVNAYHYATVHEIENSDFSPYVIVQRSADRSYKTSITEKSVKEDLRIYEVKTSAELSIPILGYKTIYKKESIAR